MQTYFKCGLHTPERFLGVLRDKMTALEKINHSPALDLQRGGTDAGKANNFLHFQKCQQ